MMFNKCKGCTTFDKVQKKCPYDNIITNKRKCPCRNCLIKITCETMCDKFEKLLFPDSQWKTSPNFIGRMMV